MATQLKGELMPIRQFKKKDKPRAILAKEKRFGAFSVLTQVIYCDPLFSIGKNIISFFAHLKTDFATGFSDQCERQCHRCATSRA